MPSNWLFVDTQFPAFTGEESMEDKISTMQNYMFMLVEQLRYSLHHLDSSNVTDIDMDKTRIYSGGTTLQTIIKDNEKFSAIEQTVAKIHAAVYGEDGESDIVIGAGGIAAQVKDLQGRTKVTLDGSALYVEDAAGNKTKITGDYISTSFADITGKLNVSKINLYDSMTVYKDSKLKAEGGRLGYTASAVDGTGGMHLRSVNGKAEAVVTDNGAKLLFVNGVDDEGANILNQMWVSSKSAGIQVADKTYLQVYQDGETVVLEGKVWDFSGVTEVRGVKAEAVVAVFAE